MIFADKLILLRKKAGWSQEELAEQMEVTRQSVSKWEGAQSIPDLEKIIRLSALFGVSTDYLLKDEIEETGQIGPSSDVPPIRRVSMEEAGAFLAVKAGTANAIAYGVLLCILSPVVLFILSALSEYTASALREDAANGIGMIVLILLVAAAAALFVSSAARACPLPIWKKNRLRPSTACAAWCRRAGHSTKPRTRKIRSRALACVFSPRSPCLLGYFWTRKTTCF